MPNSRGSAFVAFSSADEATRAVTEMNGKMAGTKPLYVALAQRKEDRRMRLQAQFAQRAVASGGMPGMWLGTARRAIAFAAAAATAGAPTAPRPRADELAASAPHDARDTSEAERDGGRPTLATRPRSS